MIKKVRDCTIEQIQKYCEEHKKNNNELDCIFFSFSVDCDGDEHNSCLLTSGNYTYPSDWDFVFDKEIEIK